MTPFIENPRKEMPHEYLRLTSLGVIGQLVKVLSVLPLNFKVHPHFIFFFTFYFASFQLKFDIDELTF